MCLDDSSHTRLFFDQGMGNSGVREIVSSRKTGDASADDNDRHWGLLPLKLKLAHDLDARLHVLDRRFRKNTVAEIEDVTRTRAGAFQQLMHAHA